MRVKKFEAKSMKEALQMVKQELGPDAVILGARDNRKNFGIGGESSIEITAAVSETTLHKKRFVESRMTAGDREKFARSDARTQRQIIDRMVEGRAAVQKQTPAEKVFRPISKVSYIDIPDEEIEESPRRAAAFERANGRRVNDLLGDFDQDFDLPKARGVRNQAQTQPAPSSTTSGAPSESALNRIRNAAREAWKSNPFNEEAAPIRRAQAQAPAAAPQPTRSSSGFDVYEENYANIDQPKAPLAPPPAPAASNAAAAVEIHTLKGEISRLQSMIEGFQKVPQTMIAGHPGADYGLSYDSSAMFQKLIEAGVAADNAAEILKAAEKSMDPVQLKKRPIVDAWAARWILDHTQTIANPIQGRIHLFVGGAGSGKTSSLVKLASHLVVKEKKRVAILSTDAFKVGAVDQLKIYCQILNVPFAVVRNRRDWEWILGQLVNVDHILVDYPGLQLRDIDEIQMLKALLPPEGTIAQTHFCVPATSKDDDALELARRYKATGYTDLIFTNLDQSVHHGIIYNLITKIGKPLHSFGIGNRIPEDFEFATKERVLDLIFKLTKFKREQT